MIRRIKNNIEIRKKEIKKENKAILNSNMANKK